MTVAPKGPLGRLTRWRRFQEELASDALRRAVHEASDATAALQVTVERLERLSQRKASDLIGGRLDPSMYAQLLAYEQQALSEQDQKRASEARCDKQLRGRQDALVAAKAQSKVADARHKRDLARAQDREEKRAYDLMADQWLAARTTRQ